MERPHPQHDAPKRWRLVVTARRRDDRPPAEVEHQRYRDRRNAEQVGQTLVILYPWILGWRIEPLCPRCGESDRVLQVWGYPFCDRCTRFLDDDQTPNSAA